MLIVIPRATTETITKINSERIYKGIKVIHIIIFNKKEGINEGIKKHKR